MRPLLQGPARLRLGVGRYRLAGALGADPRSLASPAGLAFFYCHVPQGCGDPDGPGSPPGREGWRGCHRREKARRASRASGPALVLFHRHTVLSMCSQALLAVAAAGPPRPRRPAIPSTRCSPARPPPARHRHAARHPARGARRPRHSQAAPRGPPLARLASAPMTRAARGAAAGHDGAPPPARARWHHYLAPSAAARSRPPASRGWGTGPAVASRYLAVLLVTFQLSPEPRQRKEPETANVITQTDH